ncbi:MAG: MBL fold metallo-hydrolase, partial [Pseudomonadota bacterium]|nr:MBL fold metallo-hydrolase [Pseudomonadota bacterium]
MSAVLRRCLATIAAGLVLGASALAVADGASTAALGVEQLAAGVFVHLGQVGDFAPDNGGDLANLGFVIGERCVAVIDTGGSRRVGASLLAAIRLRTALPVCYVIATHMHPDHLLGHAAFQDLHPAFVGAARQGPALAARARGYLAR